MKHFTKRTLYTAVLFLSAAVNHTTHAMLRVAKLCTKKPARTVIQSHTIRRIACDHSPHCKSQCAAAFRHAQDHEQFNKAERNCRAPLPVLEQLFPEFVESGDYKKVEKTLQWHSKKIDTYKEYYIRKAQERYIESQHQKYTRVVALLKKYKYDPNVHGGC